MFTYEVWRVFDVKDFFISSITKFAFTVPLAFVTFEWEIEGGL
jgi:hypothetical protein